MQVTYEKNGWSRVDISDAALDRVEHQLHHLGLEISEFAVRPYVTGFRS